MFLMFHSDNGDLTEFLYTDIGNRYDCYILIVMLLLSFYIMTMVINNYD